MPDFSSYILGLLLTTFLIIGALTLNVKQVIALVTSLKRLKATLGGRYSLETGKMESNRPEELRSGKFKAIGSDDDFRAARDALKR